MPEAKAPANKRRALGRGLSALIPAAPTSATVPAEGTASKAYFVCPIERIEPNPDQPRRHFAPETLDELVHSIRQHGVVQPLVVRSASREGHFQLVAGERRWRAAQRAGLHEVPVVVRALDDKNAFEIALVENIQRADLSPLEEARAYQQLLDEHGYTQEALATRLGKDRSTIANSLRLLRLSAAAQRALSAGQLTAGHARSLVGLDSAAADLLLRTILRNNLSVRQTEAALRRMRSEKAAAESGMAASANVRDLERRLAQALKTRVRLRQRSGGSGSIDVSYSSLDELDRLLECLMREGPRA